MVLEMRCIKMWCKAKTKHEQNKGGKDVVSELLMTNAHTHGANPNVPH